jgi:hypothetical protein
VGYLIMACFSVFLLFAAGVTQRTNTLSAITWTAQSQRQQAAETIRYLNVINDYLYAHPQSEGVISASLLEMQPPADVAHYIAQGRLFVYQPARSGLLDAMMAQSGRSALIGTVIKRRLTDTRGNDMQVSVPDVIPDGTLVYLN